MRVMRLPGLQAHTSKPPYGASTQPTKPHEGDDAADDQHRPGLHVPLRQRPVRREQDLRQTPTGRRTARSTKAATPASMSQPRALAEGISGTAAPDSATEAHRARRPRPPKQIADLHLPPGDTDPDDRDHERDDDAPVPLLHAPKLTFIPTSGQTAWLSRIFHASVPR